jgi:G10 protein
MRCFGQSSKSHINVRIRHIFEHRHADIEPCTGSRYIYDLYYEKEAISKKLYDWLLKNSYGDANLIAKWKKSGYEKVRFLP